MNSHAVRQKIMQETRAERSGLENTTERPAIPFCAHTGIGGFVRRRPRNGISMIMRRRARTLHATDRKSKVLDTMTYIGAQDMLSVIPMRLHLWGAGCRFNLMLPFAHGPRAGISDPSKTRAETAPETSAQKHRKTNHNRPRKALENKRPMWNILSQARCALLQLIHADATWLFGRRGGGGCVCCCCCAIPPPNADRPSDDDDGGPIWLPTLSEYWPAIYPAALLCWGDGTAVVRPVFIRSRWWYSPWYCW